MSTTAYDDQFAPDPKREVCEFTKQPPDSEYYCGRAKFHEGPCALMPIAGYVPDDEPIDSVPHGLVLILREGADAARYRAIRTMVLTNNQAAMDALLAEFPDVPTSEAEFDRAMDVIVRSL